MMCLLEQAAKLAPLATALIAFTALFIATLSVVSQRNTAKKRAAVDVFLKTEIDPAALKAFDDYTAGIEALKAHGSDIGSFDASHAHAIRVFLNMNELIAIGIRKKIFDESICFEFWHAILSDLCRDACRIIDHARTEPKRDDDWYCHLLSLNRRWSNKKRRRQFRSRFWLRRH